MSKMGADPPCPAEAGTLVFIAGNNVGGASRDRTDDLKLAKLALSQLSYGPIKANFSKFAPVAYGGPRRSWTFDLTLIRRAL
jgi:hypothetical protein